jgi:hypothetical protein
MLIALSIALLGRRFLAFVAGMALPLAANVFFKLTIAPPSEFTLNRSYAEIAALIATPERYMTILANFAGTLWSFGEWAINPLVPLLIFVGLSAGNRHAIRSAGWLTGAGAFTLVLAGYAAIYVAAPFDLQWFLTGSNSRLFLQLWPPFLLLTGLLAVQYPHAR